MDIVFNPESIIVSLGKVSTMTVYRYLQNKETIRRQLKFYVLKTKRDTGFMVSKWLNWVKVTLVKLRANFGKRKQTKTTNLTSGRVEKLLNNTTLSFQSYSLQLILKQIFNSEEGRKIDRKKFPKREVHWKGICQYQLERKLQSFFLVILVEKKLNFHVKKHFLCN